MNKHAAFLRKEGHEVFLPALDDLPLDDELAIHEYNRNLIERSDEVHMFWDGRSVGCWGDFCMAFALHKPVKLVFMERKSIQSIVRKYCGQHDLRTMESHERYDSLFKWYGRVCGDVDWRFFKAMGVAESNLDPKAVSPAGAKGIMQLMDSTAAEVGVRNPFDPEENIRGGIEYLKRLFASLSSVRAREERLKLAVASYNGGIGYIKKALNLSRKEGCGETWETVKHYLADPRCRVRGKRPRAEEIQRYVERVFQVYWELTSRLSPLRSL